jgi:hypothetical protein
VPVSVTVEKGSFPALHMAYPGIFGEITVSPTAER